MKYMFMTDLHLCDRFGKEGRYRKDCLDDLIAKVQFVIDEAKRRECGTILVGGDWFNSPRQGYVVQRALVDTMHTWPGTWTGIIGQHDIHGHDISSWLQGPASILSEMWNVAILCPSGVEAEESANGDTNFVGGVSYTENLTEDVLAFVASGDAPDHGLDVILYHALLSPNSADWLVDLKELPEGVAKVALCGDLHSGFHDVEVGGTLYVNPGALARTTPDDSMRQPTCCTVDVLHGEIELVDHIDIPCKPADEAFDLELWVSDKTAKSQMEDRKSVFVEALQGLDIQNADAVDELVARAATDKPRDVAAAALAYMRCPE